MSSQVEYLEDKMSNCCGVSVIEPDVCSKCLEHCKPLDVDSDPEPNLAAFWTRAELAGKSAEQRYFKQMERHYKRASIKEDRFLHIDGWINGLAVDVKAMKRISAKDKEVQDTYHWIELKNNNGNHGWLYGESQLIVFELEEHWLEVPRVVLAKWISQNTQRVTKREAKAGYLYLRGKAVLTLVKTSDLFELAIKIRRKEK